jgi:hypothetical protein
MEKCMVLVESRFLTSKVSHQACVCSSASKDGLVVLPARLWCCTAQSWVTVCSRTLQCRWWCHICTAVCHRARSWPAWHRVHLPA